jgi:hypothetical protein
MVSLLPRIIPRHQTAHSMMEGIQNYPPGGTPVTYTVIVTDRGRVIARHPHLTCEEAQELAAAYRALGWPAERISIQQDTSRAAA